MDAAELKGRTPRVRQRAAAAGLVPGEQPRRRRAGAARPGVPRALEPAFLGLAGAIADYLGYKLQGDALTDFQKTRVREALDNYWKK